MNIRYLFILLFFLIQLPVFSYSQKFVLTPSGLKDASDTTKNYTVINVPNKTAKQLYDKAVNYIKETFQNPDFVIKTDIDSEYIRFSAYKPKLAKAKIPIYGTYAFDAKYTVELRFKTDKIRYEVISAEYSNKEWQQDLNLIDDRSRWTGGSPFFVYDKKLNIRQANAKEQIENFFNDDINALYKYITSSTDW